MPLMMIGGDFSAFEPTPIGTLRSQQQAAASSAILKETIRLLFHDRHEMHGGTTMNTTAPPLNQQLITSSIPSSLSSLKNDDNTIHPTRFGSLQLPQQRPRQDEAKATPDNDNNNNMYTTKRFQSHQSDKWESQFQLLNDFKRKHGHCRIPHTYPENQSLARWVKRQRYQYKQKAMGEKTTMTSRRIQALEEIGFIWDSHVASWEQRMSDLMEYREKYGNCQVPTHYEENKQLAIWVKCQRRQYKLFKQGYPSTLTSDRIQELDKVGFEWKGKGKRTAGKPENNRE